MRTLQRELVRKVVFALIAFLTHGCGRFIDMYDMSCQRNTKSFVGGILDIPEFLRVDIPEFRMRAFFERTVCWTKAPKKTPKNRDFIQGHIQEPSNLRRCIFPVLIRQT